MAVPLVTQDQVAEAIKQQIPKSWKIEVFTDYPSDDDIVRFGIYVSDVHTVDRNPHALAVNLGGNIYHAIDQVKIVYVSFQDDPYNIQVNGMIGGLSSYTMIGHPYQLFDGYFERVYVEDLYYGVQSEKHTWTFQLTRLEFQ